MSRIAAPAPALLLLCLVLLPSACSSVTAAHRPAELTRQQAAGQFVCHEQDITVRELGSSEIQATGCGKTATWSCTGNTDGHDAVEILDRRCRRVTEITSQWGGGQTSPRAAKTETTQPRVGGAEPGGSTFPREEVRTALRAAEGGLRSCNDSAVPQTLHVTMRFEPSGSVSAVEVSPSGGRAASCVESRLREVAVAPFQGQPVTVRTSVTL